MSKSIEFPVIETYDQALDAVRNMNEFQFQKTGGFMFIKYTTALKSTFPDPNTAENEKQKFIYQVRRECRGIGFDVKTNRIVTRKFHKFFNLNEKPESAVENINWERPFVVIEKLDGSLVSPIRVGKQIEYTTMLGLTNYGPQLAKFVKHCMPYIDYDGFSLACIEKGISPLFEWCSEKNLIVVKYARDMLTLLAMRYTESGQYIPFQEMVSLASEFKIPVVQTWQDAPRDPQALIKAIREKEGVEGYVIRFDDGDMYKCKTNFYMRSHGINARSIRERAMWRSVLKDDIDDLIALIDYDAVLKEKLGNFRDALREGLEKRVEEIKTQLKKSEVDNQQLHKISREALKIARVNHGQEKGPITDDELLKGLSEYLKDNYLHDVKIFNDENAKLYSYVGFDCNKLIHPYQFNPKTGIMERKGGQKVDRKQTYGDKKDVKRHK